MIMSYSYLVDIGDRDFDELAPQIRELAAKMVRLNESLRGLSLELYQGKMRVKLRVAGLTRWHVGREAPRLLSLVLRRFKIPPSAATFESMVTEPGRGHLRYGQGRTEMTRRPRSERMADGRPWDHIAWEGDDLPQETRSSVPGPFDSF